MSFTDYGKSIERLGTWIAEGTKLEPGKTLFLEPALPEGPDRVAAIFETGGDWDEAREFQSWRVSCVVRAATLFEARSLAILVIQQALKKWKTSPPAARDNIRALFLAGLPALQLRDERKRVILEFPFRLDVNSRADFGVDQ